LKGNYLNYIGPTKSEISVALKLWGFDDVNQLSFIRGNENWVYQYGRFIVRFTADYHRCSDEIEAELDWILYLSSRGLSVSNPVVSILGKNSEKISEVWTCTVFDKAYGKQLQDQNDFNTEVFKRWGEMIGLLHLYSMEYHPSRSLRKSWDEDDGYILSQQALKEIKASHPMALFYKDLLSQIDGFEKSSRCYGLIHGDFHHGNFFYDHESSKMTLFDFDDSNYFWFAFDLAVPFASLELSNQYRGLNLNYRKMKEVFLISYLEKYNLDSFWIDKIEFFIKYRYTSLYFWSKGRLSNNRVKNSSEVHDFMNICEKLALAK
jgi:Ser/Thr protein kinase RdoA (MazF antagonist)